MAKGQFGECEIVAPAATGYGGAAQEGMFVERRSRRTALVLTTIVVMMVACAKLTASGALQRPDGAVGGFNSFQFVLEADSNSTAAAEPKADEPAAEEGADGRSGEEGGNVTPFNPASVGWDKSQWTTTDWVQWILPGPVVTLILSAFIFHMYGATWALGTLAVMVFIDGLAFYTNA